MRFISSSKRRLRLRKALVLHFSDLPKAAITRLGPVPLTTPLRTVVDCARAEVNAALRRSVEDVMPPRSCPNPGAFRQVLEQRVRASAGGTGMFAHFDDRAILKGGVILELRLIARERHVTRRFA